MNGPARADGPARRPARRVGPGPGSKLGAGDDGAGHAADHVPRRVVGVALEQHPALRPCRRRVRVTYPSHKPEPRVRVASARARARHQPPGRGGLIRVARPRRGTRTRPGRFQGMGGATAACRDLADVTATPPPPLHPPAPPADTGQPTLQPPPPTHPPTPLPQVSVTPPPSPNHPSFSTALHSDRTLVSMRPGASRCDPGRPGFDQSKPDRTARDQT